jgi:hypothetical protein
MDISPLPLPPTCISACLLPDCNGHESGDRDAARRVVANGVVSVALEGADNGKWETGARMAFSCVKCEMVVDK